MLRRVVEHRDVHPIRGAERARVLCGRIALSSHDGPGEHAPSVAVQEHVPGTDSAVVAEQVGEGTETGLLRIELVPGPEEVGAAGPDCTGRLAAPEERRDLLVAERAPLLRDALRRRLPLQDAPRDRVFQARGRLLDTLIELLDGIRHVSVVEAGELVLAVALSNLGRADVDGQTPLQQETEPRRNEPQSFRPRGLSNAQRFREVVNEVRDQRGVLDAGHGGVELLSHLSVSPVLVVR